METKLLLPIILQLMGVLVVITEVFIPSGGILSILAMGVFGYSLYHAFTELSKFAGFVFVIADIILIPVLIIYGLKLVAKSPVTLRKELSRKDGVTSQAPSLQNFEDREGLAMTDLRPAGLAKIDGQRVDVVTGGEYIEKGSEIKVASVGGNQIIVKLKE